MLFEKQFFVVILLLASELETHEVNNLMKRKNMKKTLIALATLGALTGVAHADSNVVSMVLSMLLFALQLIKTMMETD